MLVYQRVKGVQATCNISLTATVRNWWIKVIKTWIRSSNDPDFEYRHRPLQEANPLPSAFSLISWQSSIWRTCGNLEAIETQVCPPLSTHGSWSHVDFAGVGWSNKSYHLNMIIRSEASSKCALKAMGTHVASCYPHIELQCLRMSSRPPWEFPSFAASCASWTLLFPA